MSVSVSVYVGVGVGVCVCVCVWVWFGPWYSETWLIRSLLGQVKMATLDKWLHLHVK